MSPSDRVAQLYPQAPCSVFVAFYDSQGYGGGNLVSFLIFSGCGETESTWYVRHCWPIVPAPDDRWWLWSSWWNENWQGKPKDSEKPCPSATLSTTNPTWPDLGSNPGHRGGKPATNRLSYGTAWRYSNPPPHGGIVVYIVEKYSNGKWRTFHNMKLHNL
jgi:hypothetical protein